MPAQSRCKTCERYEQRLENFCRVCGFEFRPDDDAPNAPTGIAYTTSERYCGSCGCTRGNCRCSAFSDDDQRTGAA
jgi:hypothetical protein